jgi:hypothetical protein
MFTAVAIPGIAAVLWLGLVILNRRGVRRYDGSGDPKAGVVVFVEPVRWLWIIWGFTPFCRGLRRGGCNARIYLYEWGDIRGAALAFPDLIRQRRLQRKAARLVRFIQACTAEHPGCRLHLVGYSSGTFVAAEAVGMMPPPMRFGELLLLASSVSPEYALEPLSHNVERVHNFASPVDMVVVIGPSVFGSNDRKWGRAAGAVGFRKPAPFLTSYRWRPRDMRLGYFGDHFTIAAPRFVAERIAPLLRDGTHVSTCSASP